MEATDNPEVGGREALVRELAFRTWLAGFPELFQTPLQHDCFLQIALLTLNDDCLATLKHLYRSLQHSENAVRAYLRSLANGGWIRLTRFEHGDRRVVGLRIEDRFKEVRDAYFERLRRSADVLPEEELVRYRA